MKWTQVNDAQAYLVRIVTNVSLDQLRSARTRREQQQITARFLAATATVS